MHCFSTFQAHCGSATILQTITPCHQLRQSAIHDALQLSL
jgi:hypothetical protein